MVHELRHTPPVTPGGVLACTLAYLATPAIAGVWTALDVGAVACRLVRHRAKAALSVRHLLG